MEKKDTKDTETRAAVKKPKEEKTKLPVRYVRQPYPVSAMQADLSKQQIKILVGMMQSIQDGVQEMFERRERTGGQLLLFPELEDDHVNVDFKFSDVVGRPDYYDDVEKVAQKFVEMVFRYENKEEGEVTLSHFVDEVTYPSRGSKRDKIRFSFTKKQAETVFNFTMYSKYMLSVAFEADSKYTTRLYMLITSARGYSSARDGVFHWYVSYEQLRRMLGCDVKEGNVWVTRSRKLYKHFKADILRVAERELKALAEAGKCDCWFEFREQPEDWTGQPQSLDFEVHLSEMGLLEAQRTQEAQRWKDVEAFITAEWGFTQRECAALLGGLADGQAEEVERRVKEVAAWMKEHAAEIKEPKRYARRSLGEMAKEMAGGGDGHTEEAGKTGASGHTGVSGGSGHSGVSGVGEGAASAKALTPEEVVDKWFGVLSRKDYQMYVRGLERSMTVADGTVHVTVPHEEVQAKLEEWRGQLEKAVGMKLEVKVSSPRAAR